MVPILNRLNIGAACVGNHDFDFGVDNLIELINETNFPWLMSNCFDVKTKKPLALAHTKHLIDLNDGQLRLGVVGLVEKEWIETLSFLNYDDVIYESFVDVGRKLANELRNEDV